MKAFTPSLYTLPLCQTFALSLCVLAFLSFVFCLCILPLHPTFVPCLCTLCALPLHSAFVLFMPAFATLICALCTLPCTQPLYPHAMPLHPSCPAFVFFMPCIFNPDLCPLYPVFAPSLLVFVGPHHRSKFFLDQKPHQLKFRYSINFFNKSQIGKMQDCRCFTFSRHSTNHNFIFS